MLILKTIGFVTTLLSWLVLCWLIATILEKKYRVVLDSVYWYLWSLISAGTGSSLILIFC